MSTPTRELQSLSIGGTMPPRSRSAAQQERRARERAQRVQATQLRRTPAAIQATSTPPLTGHTGLLYDVRALTPQTRETASKGLSSDGIFVEFSGKYEGEEGSHCGFQLRGVSSVRVYGVDGNDRRITCSCDEFRRNPATAICPHIYVSSTFDFMVTHP